MPESPPTQQPVPIPSTETLLTRAYWLCVEQQKRIDRTLDYAEHLLELDNLNSDLRIVLQAAKGWLTSPAGSEPCWSCGSALTEPSMGCLNPEHPAAIETTRHRVDCDLMNPDGEQHYPCTCSTSGSDRSRPSW